MKLYTIGFTQKSAEEFFTKLASYRVKCVADVRLNNVSQLAGFSKKADLEYFSRAICGIDYVHLPELAPTQEIFDEYKKRKGTWDTYERQFLDLMAKRKVEKTLNPELLESACLLCSEAKPHHCHRRLVAEYLRQQWGNLDIVHIE